MPIERAWDRSWSREWQRGFDQTGFGAAGLTVSITVPSSTNAASWTATFTFSDDVTGFVVGDINVTNGAASAFATVNASTYTATITPTAEGTVTVEVPADSAIDGASNGNLARTVNTNYDLTDPDVTISGVPALVNGPFTATFTFTEAVSGFVVDDITVGNGTAGAFSGSGTTYTATITPSAAAVTIDVNAAVASDAAGNDNTAATQATATFDGTAPTVAITGVPALANAAFTATFTFSESTSNFVIGDITVGNGSVSSFAGSGTTYTATITPTSQGAYTVDVSADVATDAAGNGNTAATQASGTFDSVQPTVSITGVPATSTAAFTATFTFSESVTGFVVDDITVGNGNASLFSGSGTTYTASILGSSTGTITIDVNAGVASDAAGNTNTAATQQTSSFTGASFTPADLFGSGEEGGWYSPADLATVFQERTGASATTASAVGDVVGTILDKSGNSHHAVAPSDSARPVLRQTGSLYYLEFDGVDDYLSFTGLGVDEVADFVLGMQDEDAGSDTLYALFGSNAAAKYMGWAQSGSASGLVTNTSGSVTVDRTSAATRGALWTAISDGDDHVISITGSSDATTNDVEIGGYNGAAYRPPIRMYETVLHEGLSATELEDTEDHVATKSGVTL